MYTNSNTCQVFNICATEVLSAISVTLYVVYPRISCFLCAGKP